MQLAIRNPLPVHPGRWLVRMQRRAMLARHFLAMRSNLVNWRDAWSSYRLTDSLPSLHFKQGFVLDHYGPANEPISLILDVLSDRAYRRIIKEPKSGVFLDIGANIGFATLDWLSRLPTVLVHAYEPNPRSFALLSRNVEANGVSSRAKIYNQAVARTAGPVQLHTAGLSVLASAYVNGVIGEFTTVSAVSLDQAVLRCGSPIALLKLDVEGAEADILEGASTQSLAMIELVVMEYHDFLVPQASARCQRVLRSNGFRCSVRRLKHPGTGLIYASRA